MKVNRHVKIVELVNKYSIETQEELTELLKKEGLRYGLLYLQFYWRVFCFHLCTM